MLNCTLLQEKPIARKAEFIFRTIVLCLALTNSWGSVSAETTSATTLELTNVPAALTQSSQDSPLDQLETTEARLKDALAANAILTQLNLNLLTALERVVTSNETLLAARNDNSLQSARVSLATVNALHRIKSRTSKAAAVNFGSLMGEAIPLAGIAFIVGATTFELAAACDTMSDLDQLLNSFDPDIAESAESDEVCGLTVPSKAEVLATIRSSPRAAWQKSVDATAGAASWMGGLDMPSFESLWPKISGWLPDF
ncbi:hypothetical protein K3729_07515 [Rhodobacteraceae bacterium S2214]|nr:hypothetical protein K3729_07515 [Rhodobacteraceae bacterium S2214]